MKLRVCLYAAFVALALECGCGGGGSSSGAPGNFVPDMTPTAPPTPSPAASPASASVTGTVVDDADGAPLGGVSVALEPWVAGATPLPSPRATTAADGTFALVGASSGHYLLIVGDDLPGDTASTTVHDNVTLTGGAQTLQAPVLPPIPTITPQPWEANGDYRLSSLDATTEIPCVTAFNAQRTMRALPQVVVDEWLMENVRAANAYRQSPSFIPGQPWPGNSWGFLTTGGEATSGGTDCGSLIAYAFSLNALYAGDPRTQWLGAQFLSDSATSQISAVGLAQFPIDPRAFGDPNVPTWP
jgi:hypothetical protein